MSNNTTLLPKSFYLREDVVLIARELLGKVLVVRCNGNLLRAKIVETEAYCGQNDLACHASNGKRTPRTETMYREGGCAYVYLCYGIHHLFNVVTNTVGKADAVLIRAVEPLSPWGAESTATDGPGKLCKVMGINRSVDGVSLLEEAVHIEDALPVEDAEVEVSARIGVAYAGEDALLPWRFHIRNNAWVSKK
ncbi:hypothetical protein BFP72_08800 [Reichenbachiella sp. 5M10]|uniref:DNA-3-methyladenine glycosylase n=1 Tax=Reichenbachiella sp. 5M10 TaxID=1889772 RepID=UPI000C15E6B9|nr:DNA-3-methyladenine glycosylase [Reichenbachiella sp. 5M10]PIB35483.1 hypothetical protein BFP72_08800 [Reichenbachiella sp. 5M10]